MRKALIKGCILGGIIAYIWLAISWMVLPWHCWVLHSFQQEEVVSNAILQNTSKNGIYMIPNFCGAKGAEFQQKQELMKKGPFVFASVLRNGYNYSSPIPYIIALIIQLIGALFITYLMLMAKPLSYWNRVRFITLVGLTVGILGHALYCNWWGFSFGFIILEIVDLVIAWFLAGLAIAFVAKRPPLETSST